MDFCVVFPRESGVSLSLISEVVDLKCGRKISEKQGFYIRVCDRRSSR